MLKSGAQEDRAEYMRARYERPGTVVPDMLIIGRAVVSMC